MQTFGQNNNITVGSRKFHIQTQFSKPQGKIISNVFYGGEIIDTKELSIGEELSVEDISNRMNETHQAMITEMEILYYIAEKVKTVRHASSANKLGLLFLKKNLLEDSIEQFRLAMEFDPKFSEVYVNLGKALIIAASYDQAIEVLKKGVSLAPDFADIQNYLGIAYLLKRNFKEAVIHLEQALKLNPDYMEAHYHLGIALLADSLDRYDAQEPSIVLKRKKAVEHLHQVAKKIADRPIPDFENAMELISQEAYSEAVNKLIEGRSNIILDNLFNFEDEFYLKFMYGGKGKDDSFIAEYVQNLQELLEDYPHYADVRNNLGIAYLIQCRNLFLKSLEEFRTALKINPNFKKAEKNLKLAENEGKGFLILLRAILK